MEWEQQCCNKNKYSHTCSNKLGRLTTAKATLFSLPSKMATAITEIMATADPEFVAYMRTQNFTVDDATDVAEKLSVAGLHSALDFLGFCNTKGTDMYLWWADQPDWRTKGNILARLRHMFDNLEASAAAAKQQDALLMDPEVDNLIDKKTHTTLLRGPGYPCTDTAYTLLRKVPTRYLAVCGDPC